MSLGVQVRRSVAGAPPVLNHEVPPGAGAELIDGSLVVTRQTLSAASEPVRRAESSTKPASLAGSVNTSLKTTPRADDGPLFW